MNAAGGQVIPRNTPVPVIAHISDLHFGRHDPAAVEALAADMAANPADIIVNSGDFTQRSRRRQWELARQFMDRVAGRLPRICVPGNHDIPLYNLAARFLAPLAGFRRHITTEEYPSYFGDGLTIVGLSTPRRLVVSKGFWKDGSISDEQLERVSQIVREGKTQREGEAPPSHPPRLRILVAHHPFVPPRHERPRHDIVWRARQALETLGKAGVDVVLSGHLHLSYCDESGIHHAGVPGSVLCIQASTGVSSRRRSKHGNGYNRIMVESREQVVVEVREFDGAKFERARMENWNRVEGKWQMSDRGKSM